MQYGVLASLEEEELSLTALLLHRLECGRMYFNFCNLKKQL